MITVCHYECESCNRYFGQDSKYEQHLVQSPSHHYCKPCRREFVSARAMQAHLNQSEKHMACRWCHTPVGNLRLHNEQHHQQCPRCKIWYSDLKALKNHCLDDHSDVYCAPCRTLFTQPNNMIMHLRSSTHQPKNAKCPHDACGKTFVSPSALIAHFEAGTCASGVELEDVDEYFGHHIDRQQLFVKKELIYAQRTWKIPSNHHGPLQCPLCKKLFDHAGQIAFHLKSPRHKNYGRKPYTCPSERCGHATFYSLSSLLLHRETRTCEMGYRYELPKLLDRLYGIISQL
ncbi:hypothetical protein PTTG_05344 [Puccinia triticina 1-1 BBBD Race 1]|uniref:C2H2-type domain-containing protein n=2 Tax=Puccinia triticina TaxID=208348 RepID=A0A180H2N4_PUCT1|nr:uncharacterized protein PtA15_5A612 [Puccinia triticina]OAV98792.1 hypothetical protein PTTG_05344 [Puccinia triticina 1-1 BBBD Race 1]WAQ85038.1 hypothetical protein PtA15_5A612 [Puccinia triticina]WAR58373.1 hypothetical protein PtB15_5B607 [Puccinia triticina]